MSGAAGEANRSVVILELTRSGNREVDRILRRREDVFRQAIRAIDLDLLEQTTRGLQELGSQLSLLGWGADPVAAPD